MIILSHRLLEVCDRLFDFDLTGITVKSRLVSRSVFAGLLNSVEAVIDYGEF